MQDSDPLYHTRKMRQHLRETADHFRTDIEKVDEPQFKAMFETAAEVLLGLTKAFEDYEKQNEPAWKARWAQLKESSSTQSISPMSV